MIKKYYRPQPPEPIVEEFRLIEIETDNGSIYDFRVYDPSKVNFGTLYDWSFEKIIKAGIKLSPMTTFGNSMRVENSADIEKFDAVADSILNENNNDSNN